MIRIHNPVTGENKLINNSNFIPPGWLRGMTKRSKQVGKNAIYNRWIYNPILKISKKLGIDESIPNGWFIGFKNYKTKQL